MVNGAEDILVTDIGVSVQSRLPISGFLLRYTDGPEEFYALEVPLDRVEERPISHFRSARDNRSEYFGERAHPWDDTPTQELSSMNATTLLTKAERAFLVDLNSKKCLSWKTIGRHFPMHNINTLKRAHTIYPGSNCPCQQIESATPRQATSVCKAREACAASACEGQGKPLRSL